MANRDLTAPSSQAKSALSDEARTEGKTVYRKIVDEGDMVTLVKLEALANASERLESPVEEEGGTRRPSRLQRVLIAAGLLTGT
jgi:hypothetical protein